MKRSRFFTLSALFGFLFGGLMFLAPAKAAESFGLVGTPETGILFRVLGSMLLSLGVLNIWVRKHPGSPTLKAVLGTNIFAHALAGIADLSAVGSGVLMFSKIAPGMVVHVFVIIGATIYIVKME